MLQYKLVLLGDSSVGKSSIVQRFVKDSFDEQRESTIGAAFLSQTIKIKSPNKDNDQENDEDIAIKFEIWDTAGQERYRSLAPMYYRNANAAVVVYDVTAKDSLNKAITWVDELKSKVDDEKKLVISLVGNKIDLISSTNDINESANSPGRQVDLLDAENFAKEHNLLFHEVSAKTGKGVRDVFYEIATLLYKQKLEDDALNKKDTNENEDRSINVALSRPSTNDPTSCCS
ncbi:related to GTP-binding protein YPT52 [Saccharomycodes ludwigii]|uniref:Related to GTP-binding protein YPT52 n=1 Tax=Saccharomycodes ludwigii TaxID=36035 RepID=A0A376B6F5_9ASCO|nr:hypothetical protein SCDLUD_003594 [Saccharomycodes ludwigii]KAH3900602.1 hypothetical protein SCDLUD_003594 [Saccharomycodes ludwigii]SSD60159.1 related to GTP-binding protein YPT52 [Saccharomycodes ludwigii]